MLVWRFRRTEKYLAPVRNRKPLSRSLRSCIMITITTETPGHLRVCNTHRKIKKFIPSLGKIFVLYNGKARFVASANRLIRGRADKSLARPGRKQATATKLGIHSTYSPRSSIHFLAYCSNCCKPLKKIQNVVRPTRSPW